MIGGNDMKKLNSLYRALYEVKLVRCLFLCEKLIKNSKEKSSFKQNIKQYSAEDLLKLFRSP